MFCWFLYIAMYSVVQGLCLYNIVYSMHITRNLKHTLLVFINLFQNTTEIYFIHNSVYRFVRKMIFTSANYSRKFTIFEHETSRNFRHQ